ncbi:hypothetical protein WISP_129511 [Willisornis vidua]|uniref:Uncharacterized protein n=1 Tax=Willisornis vidua TaxID=1566151 RepID=A0ABQ9CW38_9PASS|nr:hypothetical protein WISP_129511 [Willisornis vidua]
MIYKMGNIFGMDELTNDDQSTACGNMSHFCGVAEWEVANLDLITSLAIVFLCENGMEISWQPEAPLWEEQVAVAVNAHTTQMPWDSAARQPRPALQQVLKAGIVDITRISDVMMQRHRECVFLHIVVCLRNLLGDCNVDWKDGQYLKGQEL